MQHAFPGTPCIFLRRKQWKSTGRFVGDCDRNTVFVGISDRNSEALFLFFSKILPICREQSGQEQRTKCHVAARDSNLIYRLKCICQIHQSDNAIKSYVLCRDENRLITCSVVNSVCRAEILIGINCWLIFFLFPRVFPFSFGSISAARPTGGSRLFEDFPTGGAAKNRSAMQCSGDGMVEVNVSTCSPSDRTFFFHVK